MKRRTKKQPAKKAGYRTLRLCDIYGTTPGTTSGGLPSTLAIRVPKGK